MWIALAVPAMLAVLQVLFQSPVFQSPLVSSEPSVMKMWQVRSVMVRNVMLEASVEDLQLAPRDGMRFTTIHISPTLHQNPPNRNHSYVHNVSRLALYGFPGNFCFLVVNTLERDERNP